MAKDSGNGLRVIGEVINVKGKCSRSLCGGIDRVKLL